MKFVPLTTEHKEGSEEHGFREHSAMVLPHGAVIWMLFDWRNRTGALGSNWLMQTCLTRKSLDEYVSRSSGGGKEVDNILTAYFLIWFERHQGAVALKLSNWRWSASGWRISNIIYCALCSANWCLEIPRIFNIWYRNCGPNLKS